MANKSNKLLIFNNSRIHFLSGCHRKRLLAIFLGAIEYRLIFTFLSIDLQNWRRYNTWLSLVFRKFSSRNAKVCF